MNPEPTLPSAQPPPHLMPLADLPALRLDEGERDPRGLEVRSPAGTVLGTVTDLLADPDRLVAAFLIVRNPEGSGTSIVPVAGVRYDGSAFVTGGESPAFRLRYQSTTRLSGIAALVAIGAVLLAFVLGVRAC